MRLGMLPGEERRANLQRRFRQAHCNGSKTPLSSQKTTQKKLLQNTQQGERDEYEINTSTKYKIQNRIY
jgi:hypothetical protein